MQNPGHPTVWHDGNFVCQTCHYGETPTTEQILNARLIAAAPDLLAALEALLDAPEWERFESVSADFVRAQDAADDAIRKAKGW